MARPSTVASIPCPAIARKPSGCATARPIDVALAAQQHERYEALLADLGCRVVSLPAAPALSAPTQERVQAVRKALMDEAAEFSPSLTGKLDWDAGKKRFTNNSEANRYLKPKFRKGWKFAG